MLASHVHSVPLRQSKRQRMLGIVFSACVHVLVLLLLSLIAIGNSATQTATLFISDQAENMDSLSEIPTFQLEPQDDRDDSQAQSPTSSPALPLDIPVRLPTPMAQPSSLTANISAVASLMGEVSAEPPTIGTTDDGSAANLAAVQSQQAAAAIQGRVGKAGGKMGEVQFALAWKDINDVDLHVIVPSGERISHQHRRSKCNGMLDVDMNVDGESTEPVENIRWITGAPWGRFTVLVNMFQVHRGAPSPRSEFELLAQLGSDTEIKTDSVSLGGDQVAVFRFTYVSSRVPQPQRMVMLQELITLQQQEESQAASRLERAKQARSPQERDRLLNQLISAFPHTDAAIEAMRLLGGSVTKR
ncbi:MAG: hypothetical protein R3C53_20515 [Pirellulaceae bacterium]